MKRKPVRTVGGSSHLTKKVGNPSTVTFLLMFFQHLLSHWQLMLSVEFVTCRTEERVQLASAVSFMGSGVVMTNDHIVKTHVDALQGAAGRPAISKHLYLRLKDQLFQQKKTVFLFLFSKY